MTRFPLASAFSRPSLAALLLACAAAPVFPATLIWDGGDPSKSLWSMPNNWNPNQIPANGDFLAFGSSPRLTSSNDFTGLTLDGIVFQSTAGAYTLSGNALSFDSDGIGIQGIENDSTSLQTINNNLAFVETTRFTTQAGPMTFNGTIALGSFFLNTVGGFAVTLNGAISGSGGVVVSTGHTVFLNGANTYTGQTQVGGTLRLGRLGALPSGSTVSIQSGGTLDLNGFSHTLAGLSGSGGSILLGTADLTFNNAATTSFLGVISGSGKLIKLGTGEQSLSASGAGNSYGGGTEVRAGTLATSTGNVLPDTGAVLVTAGTLRVNSSDTTGAVTLESGGRIIGTGALLGSSYALKDGEVTAVLGGSGGVTKTTTGTVRLAGANTYTGSTQILGGTLQTAGALPNATAVTIDGATLEVQSSDAVGAVTLKNGSITGTGTLSGSGFTLESGTVSAPLGGSATTILTKTTSATVNLNGANTYGGATAINQGVLSLGASERLPNGSAVDVGPSGTLRLNGFSESIAALSGSGAVDLGGGSLTVNATASSSFSGVISGNGGTLGKLGGGTLTLSGANSYTGQTQVLGGTIALGANGVLADASAVVVNGGTLSLGSFSETVASVNLTSGTISGTTGVLTSNGGFELSSGTAAARLGGAGGLNKVGTGVVILGGANTYAGATTVSQGTLRLGASNVVPDGSNVTLSTQTTLEMNGFSDTIGSLAGPGSVVLPGGSTLTAGASGLSTNFMGVISGAGTLAKSGAGTMTLSGNANSYTGQTRVEGGTLALPAGLLLPGGQVDVRSGATLEAKGIVNRGVIGTGTVRATGNLVVGEVSGTNQLNFGGNLDVGPHLVQLVSAGQARLSGGATIANGGRLTAFDQQSGIELASGGTLTATGNAFVNGTFLNRGTVHGPGTDAQFLTFTDDVSGPGSFTGNILFSDAYSPGASPAAVSFDNLAFDASGELIIEIGGRQPGAQFDVLTVVGQASLDGLLTVALIDGFAPALGDRFAFLTFASVAGDFRTFRGLALDDGLVFVPVIEESSYLLEVRPVPEPQTWALLLAGLALGGLLRWRTLRR